MEWWRSLASGLEHGVNVAERPAGEGALTLELAVTGLATRSGADDAIELVHEGEVVARYAHLVVTDARGERVPARMRASEAGIVIALDDTRAEYPVVIDPLVTALEATLLAPGYAADDWFGQSVALTSTGDRALVGAPQDNLPRPDAGIARVLVRTGTTWAGETTLSATDGADGDNLGTSVALSATGDRALLGAPGAGDFDRGAARVFVRTGTTWAQEALLRAPDAAAGDRFGCSVALSESGDRAIVGVCGDDTAGGADAGSARVFVRTGTTWTQEASLVAGDGRASDGFGRAVALSASGDRALVGAPLDDTAGGVDAGSARVFVRTDSTWTEEATLLAPDGARGDQLGASVALSSNGDRALVGAPRDDTSAGTDAGSARVFVRVDSSWTQEARLLGPDLGVDDGLGYSVALASSGDRALVGAYLDETASGIEAGTARLFLRTGTSWTHEVTLTAAERGFGDQFGASVALTSSGNRALVGAPLDDVSGTVNAGSAHVFRVETPTGTACSSDPQCQSGFCVDGVCCATACGGGSTTDCQACSAALTGGADGTCATLSPTVAPTVTCRPSAGACDVADTCTPSSTACPADARLPVGTECRAAAGPCDLRETCGSDPACPIDLLATPGTACGLVMGPCDAPDACTGTSAACPNTFLGADTVCRPSAGVCDVEDRCDGTSAECSNVFAVGTVCRASTGPCDQEDTCDGSGAACPLDRFLPAGAECRPSGGGACDAPDVCTGTSADCMPTFLAGVQCRASSGGCDPAEVCTGGDADCPPDQISPSGTVCRASTQSCDPAESCDGVVTSCPADDNLCAPPDAGPADAGADGGSQPVPVAGCSCRVGSRAPVPVGWLGVLAVVVGIAARRTRRS